MPGRAPGVVFRSPQSWPPPRTCADGSGVSVRLHEISTKLTRVCSMIHDRAQTAPRGFGVCVGMHVHEAIWIETETEIDGDGGSDGDTDKDIDDIDRQIYGQMGE